VIDAAGGHPRALDSVSGASENRRERSGERRLETARGAEEADSNLAQSEPVSNPASNQGALNSTSTAPTSAPAATTEQSQSNTQSVKVVMRIENGRVTQATVGSGGAGSEAVESLALRIARQRRYPAGVNKQETLMIKVDKPR
jgi:hypothetical protein